MKLERCAPEYPSKSLMFEQQMRAYLQVIFEKKMHQKTGAPLFQQLSALQDCASDVRNGQD